MFASILLFALLFQGGGQRQGQFPGQQQPTPTPQTNTPTTQQGGRQQPSATPTPEEPPVVTKHSITVGGQTINYTATAGMMPIKNREGEVEARMFFTSYVVDGPRR
ncbi:MAG TPA: hypothetical protein VIJ87_16585, partial [Pyrinomonadaceae bacterium]